MDEIDGAGHVGVDDVADIVEILVEKSTAKPATGVGQQHVDGTAAGCLEQPFNPFHGGKVGVHGVDPAALAPQAAGRVFDFGLIGRDQQFMAVAYALTGKLEADAGRSSRDDSEALAVGVVRRAHGFITTLMQPSFLSRNVL